MNVAERHQITLIVHNYDTEQWCTLRHNPHQYT
jgi:hypothetical protein